MMETQAPRTVEEAEAVWYHRIDRFLLFGYELEEAEMLAWSPVDTHELEGLLAKGCTRDLAARILL